MSPEKESAPLPKDIQVEVKEIDNAVKNLEKKFSELVAKLKHRGLMSGNSCGRPGNSCRRAP